MTADELFVIVCRFPGQTALWYWAWVAIVSPPTITKYLNELIADGRVTRIGKVKARYSASAKE